MLFEEVLFEDQKVEDKYGESHILHGTYEQVCKYINQFKTKYPIHEYQTTVAHMSAIKSNRYKVIIWRTKLPFTPPLPVTPLRSKTQKAV
jgi:hypothetical protein